MRRTSWLKQSLLFVGLSLAFGCNPGATGGCGGFEPLPPDPKPFGFPPNQTIEGAVQLRVAKSGIDKLTQAIPGALKQTLGGGVCALKKQSIVFDVCSRVDCVDARGFASEQGCPAFVYFDSKDRPAVNNPRPNDSVRGNMSNVLWPTLAPANQDDGKNRILLGFSDSNETTPPRFVVDVTFDYLVPIYVDAPGILGGDCYLYVHNQHVRAGIDNLLSNPIRLIVTIEMSTDPLTGELKLELKDLAIPDFDVQLSDRGGVSVCSVVNIAANFLFDIRNRVPAILRNFIADVLRPQLDDILQQFLPKPSGVAGQFNTEKSLERFHPPKGAHLEILGVLGGYVKSNNGGLTIGAMSGFNSDRDITTRSPGLTSEPSLCVPLRPTPDLSKPPWNLPFNAQRMDFTLQPAGVFAGDPEPTTSTGAPTDIGLGLSRTYLDLAGFHLYNSGSLCLQVGSESIPSIGAGALTAVVPSLNNILQDANAPISAVLRPQQPLSFTLGPGTADRPLLNVGISDLRTDLYVFLEERFVRLLTIGFDINLGLNLTVTKDSQMRPAIQPTVVGLSKENIIVRAYNTDLLRETPDQLKEVLPELVGLALGSVGGSLPSFALPAAGGYQLDEFDIRRVQTNEEDFLGIFAAIKKSGAIGLMNWADPEHPVPVGNTVTHASVDRVDQPRMDLQQLAFDSDPVKRRAGALPSVSLILGADGHEGRPVEYSWRVDGGLWNPWTSDERPRLNDAALHFQGRHEIEVRSRIKDAWSTEDTTPEKLTVLIDGVAPTLAPYRENDQIMFAGRDYVTKPSALRYAWQLGNGEKSSWVTSDHVAASELEKSVRNGFVTLYAMDETGNIGEAKSAFADLGLHNNGVAGCACAIVPGDSSSTKGALFFALLMAAWVLRRRMVFLRRAFARIGVLVLLVGLLGQVGCGCDNRSLQCRIDDECSSLRCLTGQIPQCQERECACIQDVNPGDVGRFSTIAVRGNQAYVAAYNTSYGDLMVGKAPIPGVAGDWEFVDGVPDAPPQIVGSQMRGGISERGDDVGLYTSIQIGTDNRPIVAYYDQDHKALKFTYFGQVRWRNYFVDQPKVTGEDLGKWAAMTLGPDGRPAIAYSAIVKTNTLDGAPESQLRWAQAKVAVPTSPDDWEISIIDSRPVPPPPVVDGGTTPRILFPESIAIMASVARHSDGTPGIAYYDRERGNLRYTELNPQTNLWIAPILLDGEDGQGRDIGDVGQYPSLTFDENDVGQISYVDSTRSNLLYINLFERVPEVIDDGYRPMSETTSDGLDSPVFHFVGDSSSIQTFSDQIIVAYQDATAVQLRLATRGADKKWKLSAVAGHANPFAGAYGFYANLRIVGEQGVISSYAINQQLPRPQYYVEIFTFSLGTIIM